MGVGRGAGAAPVLTVFPAAVAPPLRVAWRFFGTAPAKEAVRQKVAALFPAHEHEKFTEHFWDRIQQWRKSEERS